MINASCRECTIHTLTSKNQERNKSNKQAGANDVVVCVCVCVEVNSE